MLGGDVADLMGEHGGDLGGVVGQRQQAAGDVEPAVRQCEGIHRRRIQNGDLIGADPALAGLGQTLHHLVEQGAGARRAIFAAEGRQKTLMLAFRGALDRADPRRDLAVGGLLRRQQHALVARAAEQQQRRQRQRGHPGLGHRSCRQKARMRQSIRSRASGDATSSSRPSRPERTPRARKRLPPSPLAVQPASFSSRQSDFDSTIEAASPRRREKLT